MEWSSEIESSSRHREVRQTTFGMLISSFSYRFSIEMKLNYSISMVSAIIIIRDARSKSIYFRRIFTKIKRDFDRKFNELPFAMWMKSTTANGWWFVWLSDRISKKLEGVRTFNEKLITNKLTGRCVGKFCERIWSPSVTFSQRSSFAHLQVTRWKK